MSAMQLFEASLEGPHSFNICSANLELKKVVALMPFLKALKTTLVAGLYLNIIYF